MVLVDVVELKGDCNPNNKYVLLERTVKTLNFDTSVIKIGLKNEEVIGI